MYSEILIIICFVLINRQLEIKNKRLISLITNYQYTNCFQNISNADI